ncbi:MAG: glycosyltransferase family 2 protein [Lachnospiraceae bacterium]|nr:glycosyltransferase family 2 protein [Lachnospiraceae bacterium]
MDKLYIVIPAYNEQENLGTVIDEWYPIIEKYHGDGASRLVIIDDGSKDRTLELLKEYAETRPFLQPLTKENGGHGSAVLFGYHYALEQGADYVFQTDSDGQTLVSEFDMFWQARNDHDMVIGWRKGRQDGVSRVFVTRVLKWVVRICFGTAVQDANTPYRIMKAEKLKEYIGLVPDDFFLSNVLLTVIFTKRGTVKYLPITFRPRQGGANSINMKKIIRVGWQALKDFKKINRLLG